jgi:hypothetical protein
MLRKTVTNNAGYISTRRYNMRKMVILLMAMTMVAAMIIPLVSASADTPDNKPVAWVSWDGSNANSKDELGSHIVGSVSVKKLSDGSTVGHMWFRNFTTGTEDLYDVVDSHFEEVGVAKVAHILVRTDSDPWYLWYQLKDLGEPAAGTDTYRVFIWADRQINPSPPPPFIYLPDGQPAWPPVFNSAAPFPRWVQYSPGEIPIVSGNIQVHMPEP